MHLLLDPECLVWLKRAQAAAAVHSVVTRSHGACSGLAVALAITTRDRHSLRRDNDAFHNATLYAERNTCPGFLDPGQATLESERTPSSQTPNIFEELTVPELAAVSHLWSPCCGHMDGAEPVRAAADAPLKRMLCRQHAGERSVPSNTPRALRVTQHFLQLPYAVRAGSACSATDTSAKASDVGWYRQSRLVRAC